MRFRIYQRRSTRYEKFMGVCFGIAFIGVFLYSIFSIVSAIFGWGSGGVVFAIGFLFTFGLAALLNYLMD